MNSIITIAAQAKIEELDLPLTLTFKIDTEQLEQQLEQEQIFVNATAYLEELGITAILTFPVNPMKLYNKAIEQAEEAPELTIGV